VNVMRRLLFILTVLASGGFLMFAGCQGDDTHDAVDETEPGDAGAGNAGSTVSKDEPLPAMVDLGRGTCAACKKMKPILEELTTEYEGKAIIRFVDLKQQPDAAKTYGIRLIPTQIFFDVDGNEVFRHEGFMSKEAIVAKFSEMGVDL